MGSGTGTDEGSGALLDFVGTEPSVADGTSSGSGAGTGDDRSFGSRSFVGSGAGTDGGSGGLLGSVGPSLSGVVASLGTSIGCDTGTAGVVTAVCGVGSGAGVDGTCGTGALGSLIRSLFGGLNAGRSILPGPRSTIGNSGVAGSAAIVGSAGSIATGGSGVV